MMRLLSWLTIPMLLLGWELLVRIAGIPPYTLPAPSLVAQTLWANFPSLAASWWFTLKITFGALALACAGGIAIAAVFALWRPVEVALFPLAIMLQVTPLVAIAPVAFIAKDGQFSWWQWLKVAHGFRDEALRPYTYNLGPFLANRKAIQQGYSFAEPIYAEKQGQFKPVVHLLADHGFSTYSTLIETRVDTVNSRPDLVQRFVDASIEGWVNYLYGDRRAANALMIRDNPEMTVAEIEAAVALMRAQGIVDSGESLTNGVGAMNQARIRDFHAQMVRAGLYKQGDVDPARVATLQFVNRKVGLALKSRLTAR